MRQYWIRLVPIFHLIFILFFKCDWKLFLFVILGWSVLFYFIASNYQPIIFILASCLICIFLTKLLYQSQNNKSDSSKTQNSSAFANGHAPTNGVMKLQQNGLTNTPLNSDAKPYLWTTNESPVYGSPTSTSPLNRKSPRNLTQYSYDR